MVLARGETTSSAVGGALQLDEDAIDALVASVRQERTRRIGHR